MHKRASYQPHALLLVIGRVSGWWLVQYYWYPGTVVNHVQTPLFHQQQLPSCSQARIASHRQGFTAFFALSGFSFVRSFVASTSPAVPVAFSTMHLVASDPPPITIAGAKNVTTPKEKHRARGARVFLKTRKCCSLQNPASVLSHRPTRKHDSAITPKPKRNDSETNQRNQCHDRPRSLLPSELLTPSPRIQQSYRQDIAQD